jgi:hypothetical protein
MQLFLKLFGPYLQWVYHCFDRIVINGHLLGLMRESQVVYFFRDVCGHPKIRETGQTVISSEATTVSVATAQGESRNWESSPRQSRNWESRKQKPEGETLKC